MYKPNADEFAALLKWANEHGRTWKQALRDEWMGGRDRDGPTLRNLRNNPDFGPRGLVAFRFPKI